MFRYSIFLLSLLILGCSQDKKTIAINEKININLEELTIEKIQNAYQNGDFTITQLVQAYLDRIDSLDRNGPQLNSILLVNPEALAIAKAMDAEMKSGKTRGAMHGIPIILKDNIDASGMPTTAGALALKDSKPLKDSWVVQKLKASGAIIIAKSNLSEWANFHSNFSSSGWSAVGGQTKNPYELSRNPCGSSSGSGAAVSANFTVLAIGTETNGSIVCPANNNGIVGIKPTVGLISRSGIVPISFTQDTPGPMARTVTDAAICLGALVGIDSSDAKTLLSSGKTFNDYTPFLKRDGLKGKTIGVWQEPLGKHFRVDAVFRQAVEDLKNQGATIIEIDVISLEDIESPSYEVLLYEFKDGLNQYFASLGEDAKVKSVEDLIELTMNDSIEMQYFDHALLQIAQNKGDLNSAEYKAALQKMLLHSQQEGIDRVMNLHQLDAIVAPTGGTAWKTDLTNGDHFGVYSSSPAAIAGYPAITVPMGQIDGLPLGISFFGKAWSESILIEMAYAYEQATLHRKTPQFKP
jgi:amidase